MSLLASLSMRGSTPVKLLVLGLLLGSGGWLLRYFSELGQVQGKALASVTTFPADWVADKERKESSELKERDVGEGEAFVKNAIKKIETAQQEMEAHINATIEAHINAARLTLMPRYPHFSQFDLWIWNGEAAYLYVKQSCAVQAILDEKVNLCWGSDRVRKVWTHCDQYGDGCTGEHYNNPAGTVDVDVFVTDAFHISHLTKSTSRCNLAWTAEPPSIDPGMHQAWQQDPTRADPFDRVLTYNTVLLSQDPKKFGRLLEPGCHVKFCKNPLFWSDSPEARNFHAEHFRKMLESKSKGVSIIFSSKKSAPGHKLRHEVWELFKSNGLMKGCGHGAGNHVDDKSDCLNEFMFSVIIENGRDLGYYFSEKLVDPMLTATVPLYWGKGKLVSELFDPDGFMLWETLEELRKLFDRINTPEKQRAEYEKRKKAMQCNYFKAMTFAKPLWERITDFSVGPNGEVNCNLCPSANCSCNT